MLKVEAKLPISSEDSTAARADRRQPPHRTGNVLPEDEGQRQAEYHRGDATQQDGLLRCSQLVPAAGEILLQQALFFIRDVAQ